MSKNVSKCSDGKDIAQANMQRLIDLLKEFHAAVRAFGQKGWLKRAFTMQSHVKKLGLIDKRIVEQLGVFRLSYRLAIDSQMMERTYQIEQSIAALVAKRVVEKGDPRRRRRRRSRRTPSRSRRSRSTRACRRRRSRSRCASSSSK